MADKKFTLLELHLDGESIQFGPSSIGDVGGVGGETEAEAETETPDESADHAGARRCGKAGKLFAVVALVVVAAVVAKRLAGGDDELADLDELDDVVE